MHKITGDMTQIAAQIPALFEALSGMKMSDLLGKIKTIGDNSETCGSTAAFPTEPAKRSKWRSQRCEQGVRYGTYGSRGNTGAGQSQ